MLRSFRGMAKGWGAYLLVFLFFLAFAVVGVPSLNNYGRGATISVGDSRFTIRDVEAELVEVMDFERRTNDRVITREAAISEGLLDTAVNRLLLKGIYGEEAKALGVTVTDKVIQDYLNAQENLQNPRTGKFDQTILQRIVQSNNISIPEFKRRVAEDLVQNQIDSAVRVGLTAPESIGRLIALRQTEERTVKTATLPVVDATEADEAALQSYYATYADRYALPERRTYSVLMLDPDVIRAGMTVDEGELQQAYAARVSQLSTPETRSFTQAQFSDADTAQRVADAVSAGSTFAAAAMAEGVTTTTFTDQVKANLIDTNVANAVFDAAEPGVVGPIDGDFGRVVAIVESITPAVTVALADVRAELEADLLADESGRLLTELYDTIQEAGDGGQSLAEAAAIAEMDVQSVGPVDASMRDLEGNMVDAVPFDIHDAAFTLPVDAIFEEVELAGGAIAFVEVSEIIAETPQAFETVIDQVTADYEADRADSAITETAAQFEALIAQGTAFDDAVAEMGGVSVARTLSNQTSDPAVPPALVRAIYNLSVGDVTSGSGVNPNEAFVAQVESVRFTPNAQIEIMQTRFRTQLSQTLSGELYEAYLAAAQETFGTEQNAAELAANFGDTP